MIKNPYRQESVFWIACTFLLASLLASISLSEPLEWIRPNFLGLAVLAGMLMAPEWVGVTTAFLVGLVQDNLSGGLLGEHALAMVFMVFLARLLRHRVRFFSLSQQIASVFILLSVAQCVSYLEQCFIGIPPRTLLYWAPVLSTTLFWPFVYLLLKKHDRKVIR